MNNLSTKALISTLFALTIWGSYYALMRYLLAGDAEAMGHFGDTFGGVSAFFAIASFLAILFSLYQQRAEHSAFVKSQTDLLRVQAAEARVRALTLLLDLEEKKLKNRQCENQFDETDIKHRLGELNQDLESALVYLKSTTTGIS